MMNGSSDYAVEKSEEIKVPAKLKHFISHNDDFTKVSFDDLSSFKILRQSIEQDVQNVANQLLGAIVKFNEYWMHITSGNMFVHNYIAIDDCAYGINFSEFHSSPLATIRERTYMGTSSYYELSIHGGSMSSLLLVVSIWIAEVKLCVHR
ncbi:hypothetical protein RMCBS344292_07059 [Rhizopus microsporus]|nr:hypothetical protein RMCBS344292_07059 [Rhizopus microsporus]